MSGPASQANAKLRSAAQDDERATTTHLKRTREPPGSQWLFIGMLVLILFSTIFSTIFLVIALLGRRNGQRISERGVVTPSQAAVLTALIAKAIEVSFATAFVAFVGQHLTNKALKHCGPGVTLCQMNVRN